MNDIVSFTDVKIKENPGTRGYLGNSTFCIKHFLISCKEHIELNPAYLKFTCRYQYAYFKERHF